MQGENKERVKIAIIYGGPVEEHEVSVRSAKNILENIDKSKYEVKEFHLSKKAKVVSKKIIIELKSFLVWPIFHGEFGEGGYVQEVLEKNRIKYIGSNSKVSKLTIDKLSTQKVLEKHKISVPKSLLVSSLKDLKKVEKSKMFFPLILKPKNGGSSVDLFKVKNFKELEKCTKILLKKYKVFLLQEFISGREFTCGVLSIGKKILPFPVSEVILQGQEVFDYNTKYATSGIEHTPASIKLVLSSKIQKLACKVHKTLGCSGVTRTDMILSENNELYVLEINTIPGMTKVSFIPEQLKCLGITMSKFIDIMTGYGK